MSLFRPARTFGNPAQGSNAQRGFPAPGAGDQTTNPAGPARGGGGSAWQPVRPSKGTRTFFKPAQGANAQRGFPAPEGYGQGRPPGSMPPSQVPNGLNNPVWTPYYSRGAAAYVQDYGKVLVNPIGAGIVANFSPVPLHDRPARYINGIAFWTAQGTPTSIPSQGLNSADELGALLGSLDVQAAVRVA